VRAAWELKGLDDYFETLEKAEVNINVVSREGLAEAGKMLQAEMQIGCRVDKLLPYIKIFTPTREGNYNYVAVGFVHDLAFTPKWAAILANVIEFGSVHNEPMPFIRPAVRRMRSQVNALIAAKLKAATLVDE
jgi:hypothetical protein